MSAPTLQRYEAALMAIPRPGAGCHRALLGVANHGVRAGLDDARIIADITRAIPAGGARPVPESEVRDAVRRARADVAPPCPVGTTAAIPPARHAPPPARDDDRLREAIIAAGGGEIDPDGADFRESSPLRIDWPPEADAAEFLSSMFLPHEHVFVGHREAAGKHYCRTAEEWCREFSERMTVEKGTEATTTVEPGTVEQAPGREADSLRIQPDLGGHEATPAECFREWDAGRLIAAGVPRAEVPGIIGTLAGLCGTEMNAFAKPPIAENLAARLSRYVPGPSLDALIRALKAVNTPDQGTSRSAPEPGGPARATPVQRTERRRHGTDADRRAVVVALDRIVCEPLAQLREHLDASIIEEYTQAMRAGSEFPPVITFGEMDGGDLILADGYHRLEATRRAGLDSILAEIRPGDRWDTLKFALSANGCHGLRRTRRDVAKAIQMAYEHRAKLDLPETPSARMVADLVGCSDKTAETELRKFRSWADAPTRTGADGKARSTRRPAQPQDQHHTPIPAGMPVAVPAAGDAEPLPASPMPAAPPAAEPRDPGPERASGLAVAPAATPTGHVAQGPQTEGSPATPEPPLARATAKGWPADTDPTAEDLLEVVVNELRRDGDPAAARCLDALRGVIEYRYPAFYERVRQRLLPFTPASAAAA